MIQSRRKTLALIGGGAVLAATSAAGAFLATRTPTSALEPWILAGTYAEPRLRALSFALLAPNPHNLQPWAVSLDGEDGVLIWRDTDRALPQTDPFDRQITIGFGCFLELMRIAATLDGLAVQIEPFPEGADSGLVARARFGPGAEPDPLARHIMERRSCKEPFEDRAVPMDALAALGRLAPHADLIDDPQEVAALRDLTWRAWMIEAQTERTHRESVELMRFGRAEIEANPDGIDLGGPFLESLMLAGVLSREAQLDRSSQAFQTGVEIYREMLAATTAYAALRTEANTRADQIAAGARWVRLNLATTSLGLALHPVSQALQEYPEMAGPYDEAHALLAEPGETVQMLGRLGYGPSTPRTPRWPLEAKRLDA